MKHKQIPPEIIRQIFIIVVVLGLASLIITKLLPFLSGILGAITLYVVMRKAMITLTEIKKWPQSLAAGLLMFLSFIVILIPIGGVFFLLGKKIKEITENSSRIADPIKNQLKGLEENFGVNLESEVDPSGISTWIAERLQEWIGTTVNAVMAIVLMYFLLYFMLIHKNKLHRLVCEYIPMNRSNLDEIGSEVRGMVRANAIGIPLVGLAQGIVALIGFFIFNIDDPFFWFVILSISSMVPFVGTLSGMIPVFILTLSTGDTFAAWGILIYGFVVVGMTDNITRLYFLKKLEDVHPLVTLIGVIVGVPLFGFIGLIFGPLLVSLFLLIVKIYRQEYGKYDELTQEERL